MCMESSASSKDLEVQEVLQEQWGFLLEKILHYQKPRKTFRNSWKATKTKLNSLRWLPSSYLKTGQKPTLSAAKALMCCATPLYQQNGYLRVTMKRKTLAWFSRKWHCPQWFKASHHCLYRYRCCWYSVECFLRHVDHWVVVRIRIWQKLQVTSNSHHCRTTGRGNMQSTTILACIYWLWYSICFCWKRDKKTAWETWNSFQKLHHVLWRIIRCHWVD